MPCTNDRHICEPCSIDRSDEVQDWLRRTRHEAQGMLDDPESTTDPIIVAMQCAIVETANTALEIWDR